jgi:broad specificity phosphatase PhoE
VLILVRHAVPAYDESTPAEHWPLSDEGAAEARALPMPPGAYLVASDEVKAWQTLQPFGTVTRDPRFGEVRRDTEPWDGPYRTLRRAYVDGADHDGWEPRAEVVERFDRAVRDHTVRAGARHLVVASHGMAMTVWLTAKVGIPAPAQFWESLRFPDRIFVNLP